MKKNIFVPVVATLLVGVTFAAAQSTKVAPATTTPQTQQSAPSTMQRPALTVKYYAGDPLNGGKLLSTETIQPQSRATQNSSNAFANAPKGTTHVSITTPFGTRISTLQNAQANLFHDGEGRHGRGGNGQGGDCDPSMQQNQTSVQSQQDQQL
ncbi:hypothetical protein [Deinococcus yavapaiensis]|uniref:Uncharacterized protein n=1 Tax=Deinococcus yavapaiensis KR-236 TaxID=694435 RepID=A0A318S376_9DEIO|nr:hypothetical protein [Deinococcus yavapaiensis]PYE50469.1 hypothetical protein DES52_11886 [Deinococcus yavapaiensis KR-236]